MRPLLHLWSLAVEEQFYVLYPIYLVWFPPLNRSGKFLFLTIFILSALVGFYGHVKHPSAAFYLLPCRIWEFLVGGALCLIPAKLSPNRRFSAVAVPIGLLAILGCSFVPMKSWIGLVPPGLFPCLGAAAVIYGGLGEGSAVTRILRSRPLVAVGLISYSLYLWHWPLLAFLEHAGLYLQLGVDNLFVKLCCLLVSAVMAVASYFLVEQPIRRRLFLSSDSGCLFAHVATIGVCFLASATLIRFDGVPRRFDARVLRYLAAQSENFGEFERCMTAADVREGSVYSCGPQLSNRRWLLIGDSHAMSLLHGLKPLAVRNGIRIDQATRPATAPLLGFQYFPISQTDPNEGAADFVTSAIELVQHDNYECVIFYAFWEQYVQSPSFSASFQRTIRFLASRNRPSFIVLPIPYQQSHVPLMLTAAARLGQDIDTLGVPISTRDSRILPLQEALRSLDAGPVHVLDPAPALADSKQMVRAELDGESLYIDDNHLSKAGSRRVAELLVPKLLQALGNWKESKETEQLDGK